MNISNRIMNGLGGVQESKFLKTVEPTILFTPVAAITNIAVSILRFLGSVILLAMGDKKNTAFKSAFKQLAWGSVTVIPVIGAAIALGTLGFKAISNQKKLEGITRQNGDLKNQMVQVTRGLKEMKIQTLGLVDLSDNGYFPELAGKGLHMASMAFKNTSLECESNIDAASGLDEESNNNIRKLKKHFGDKELNVLSLIDLQKDFLKGGSLQVTDQKAQDQLWSNLENLLKSNEFDAIVLTKDFHPEKHKSFTSTYYDFGTDDSEGYYTIKPNKAGNEIGITLRQFWNSLPMGAEFEIDKETSSLRGEALRLKPKTEGAREALLNGRLMPFSKALHPVLVTEAMFSRLEKPSEIVNLLKSDQFQLLNTENKIDPYYQPGGCTISLFEAFSVPVPKTNNEDPSAAVWDDEFVENMATDLKKTQEETLAILNCLLEDLWPNHCQPGTEGHKFHDKLVEILEKQAKHIPIIPLVKGNNIKFGESYSAGLNTKGFLATPYLLLLKALNVKNNVVCGVATGYCPSGTAKDAQKAGIKTTYWLPGTAAIVPAQEAFAVQGLKKAGVTVIERSSNPSKEIYKIA